MCVYTRGGNGLLKNLFLSLIPLKASSVPLLLKIDFKLKQVLCQVVVMKNKVVRSNDACPYCGEFLLLLNLEGSKGWKVWTCPSCKFRPMNEQGHSISFASNSASIQCQESPREIAKGRGRKERQRAPLAGWQAALQRSRNLFPKKPLASVLQGMIR